MKPQVLAIMSLDLRLATGEAWGREAFMLVNLLAGTAVISATVVIHTFGLIAVTHVVAVLTGRFGENERSKIIAMLVAVLGIFVVMAGEIWLWAICQYSLGVVAGLRDGSLLFDGDLFDGGLRRHRPAPRLASCSRQWKA